MNVDVLMPVSPEEKVRAKELLCIARERIEPGYRRLLDSMPASPRHMVGFHRGWWEADGAVRSGGTGKSLRPALTILCAAAAESDPAQALEAALCVELIHDWSLIHDDVMDEDAERRHRPTVWAQFGVPHAVLTGDLVLSLALQVAGRLTSPGLHIVTETIKELCLGQWSDLDSACSEALTVDEVLATAASKTGALLGAACHLGALNEGPSSLEAEHYANFGRELGIVFQATDDILGIWGDPTFTGKPVASDIVARKQSLPICAALSSGHSAVGELADIFNSPKVLTGKEVSRAVSLIEITGGREWTEALARDHTVRALEQLDAAAPDQAARDDLWILTRTLTKRTQ